VTLQHVLSKSGDQPHSTRELQSDSDRTLTTLARWHVDLNRLHAEIARTRHREIQFLLGVLIFAVEDAIGAAGGM
jgi:hypothetical protein